MAHPESSDREQSNPTHASNSDDGMSAQRQETRPKPPTTFGQLLCVAYERKGLPVALSTKQQKIIAQNLTISSDLQETLRLLASRDVHFAVPRELLLMASAPNVDVKLRGALQDVARSALLAHPLLSRPELQDAIRNTDEGLEPSAAIASVMQLEPRDVESQAVKDLRPAEFARLRLNVAHTLALEVAQLRSFGDEALANLLYLGIWKEEGCKIQSGTKQQRVLTDPGQLKGMATTSSVFQNAADHARKHASDLKFRMTQTSQKLVESQSANATLQQRMEEQEQRHAVEQAATVARLTELKAHAEDQAVLLRDERETLRTRMLRALRSDLELLQLGLEAAHRPVPKTNVLVDAVERVTDSLRYELGHLEGE